MIFADVIVDISLKSLDRPFQYSVPDELLQKIEIGSVVCIPFGKGNRTISGYVVGLSGTAKFSIEKTKQIISVQEQGIAVESELLALAFWIKENYGATMNDAIKVVLPVKKEVREKQKKTVFPLIDREKAKELKEIYEKKHYSAKMRLMDQILLLTQKEFQEGIPSDRLMRKAKVTSSVLKDFEKKGLLKIESERQYRNPIFAKIAQKERPLLNEEQKQVVDSVIADWQKGLNKTYLLHGVTGSGKTEVYMHIIEQVVKEGKQVIVLIPEIALTFQTINRFYARFGDRVSVMHSRLSAGERYDQFLRAKSGDIDIMIGPRSALFTPFENLGFIVVDEEHEGSYQSEMPPKYHAREVAIWRAKMVGASVMLGSATPSLESYYRAQKGEYHLFTLKQRAGNASFPKVWITDLRQEFAEHNYSIFGKKLAELIEDRLQKKEQIILFLNRRGYAGSVACRKCGHVLKCPHCDVSLSPHLNYGKVDLLECHYCGHREHMPSVCPECGSKYIGSLGIGTQKIEELTKKCFPNARVLRMDRDTTQGKDGHEKILKQFASLEADILIGTQMIVKGHDFPNVTLVGILAADLSLNICDFRAAERTYQLLAQAAGRAGRADKPGDVVLQTYQPEHYCIQAAKNQNYQEFYEQELKAREILQYPPVSNILGVLVLSEKLKEAEELSDYLASQMKKYDGNIVLGPSDDTIAKVKDIYRKIVYAKNDDYRILRTMKDQMEEYLQREKNRWRNCTVQFNFNM